MREVVTPDFGKGRQLWSYVDIVIDFLFERVLFLVEAVRFFRVFAIVQMGKKNNVRENV